MKYDWILLQKLGVHWNDSAWAFCSLQLEKTDKVLFKNICCLMLLEGGSGWVVNSKKNRGREGRSKRKRKESGARYQERRGKFGSRSM